jgi:hypothetical protein
MIAIMPVIVGAPIPTTAKRVDFFIYSCIPVVQRMQTDVDGVRER